MALTIHSTLDHLRLYGGNDDEAAPTGGMWNENYLAASGGVTATVDHDKKWTNLMQESDPITLEPLGGDFDDPPTIYSDAGSIMRRSSYTTLLNNPSIVRDPLSRFDIWGKGSARDKKARVALLQEKIEGDAVVPDLDENGMVKPMLDEHGKVVFEDYTDPDFPNPPRRPLEVALAEPWFVPNDRTKTLAYQTFCNVYKENLKKLIISRFNNDATARAESGTTLHDNQVRIGDLRMGGYSQTVDDVSTVGDLFRRVLVPAYYPLVAAKPVANDPADLSDLERQEALIGLRRRTPQSRHVEAALNDIAADLGNLRSLHPNRPRVAALTPAQDPERRRVLGRPSPPSVPDTVMNEGRCYGPAVFRFFWPLKELFEKYFNAIEGLAHVACVHLTVEHTNYLAVAGGPNKEVKDLIHAMGIASLLRAQAHTAFVNITTVLRETYVGRDLGEHFESVMKLVHALDAPNWPPSVIAAELDRQWHWHQRQPQADDGGVLKLGDPLAEAGALGMSRSAEGISAMLLEPLRAMSSVDQRDLEFARESARRADARDPALGPDFDQWQTELKKAQARAEFSSYMVSTAEARLERVWNIVVQTCHSRHALRAFETVYGEVFNRKRGLDYGEWVGLLQQMQYNDWTLQWRTFAKQWDDLYKQSAAQMREEASVRLRRELIRKEAGVIEVVMDKVEVAVGMLVHGLVDFDDLFVHSYVNEAKDAPVDEIPQGEHPFRFRWKWVVRADANAEDTFPPDMTCYERLSERARTVVNRAMRVVFALRRSHRNAFVKAKNEVWGNATALPQRGRLPNGYAADRRFKDNQRLVDACTNVCKILGEANNNLYRYYEHTPEGLLVTAEYADVFDATIRACLDEIDKQAIGVNDLVITTRLQRLVAVIAGEYKYVASIPANVDPQRALGLTGGDRGVAARAAARVSGMGSEDAIASFIRMRNVRMREYAKRVEAHIGRARGDHPINSDSDAGRDGDLW